MSRLPARLEHTPQFWRFAVLPLFGVPMGPPFHLGLSAALFYMAQMDYADRVWGTPDGTVPTGILNVASL